MSDFPFNVKSPELAFDTLVGYPALHPAARDLLYWLCGFVAEKKWAKPTITCFGRTRQAQAKIYTPHFEAKIGEVVKVDSPTVQRAAHKKAWEKFSWHCLPAHDPQCRAFDVRTQLAAGDRIIVIYSDSQCAEIVRGAKAKFPGCEALHHTVTAPHLHLAIPAATKPVDWL